MSAATDEPSWTHRPALDGLRAIAVYLVLLFHSGVAAVSGGFIGVDLFFVLSGFLVSSILLDELHATGRLDLGRFYARRVRRLLPAAIVVVLATAGVYWLVAPTATRLSLVGDAQSALLYVANWRFLLESNAYFGSEVARSPYLHFWSLSIEEQFYFVFPLFLVGMFALARRWRHAVLVGVVAVLVLSVASQLFWAARELDRAYYGTDARMYQLMAGVLAALWWRHRRVRPLRGPLPALLGLVGLLVVGSGLVDLSPSTRGLLATIAATLLIAGLMADDRQPLVRVLSGRIPTYLGRISYGTYLWHWPVLLILGMVLEVGPWMLALLAVPLSTSLAALSFEVLEHPVRTARSLSRFGYSTLVVGVACSALLAVTAVPGVLGADRLPALRVTGSAADDSGGRPVPAGVDWQRYIDDKGVPNTSCTTDDTTSCVVHEGSSGLHVALLGDSHARVLAPAVRTLAQEHDFTLSLGIEDTCSWKMDVVWQSDALDLEKCQRIRDDFYGRLIETMDVDVVLLSESPRDSERAATKISHRDGRERSLEEVHYDTSRETLESIEEAGATAVILEAMLTPARLDEEQQDPLECLSGARNTAECVVQVPLRSAPIDAFYRTFAVRSDRVATVTIDDIMCADPPLCAPMIGKIPVWRDENHFAPAALTARRDAIWDRLVSTGFFDAAS